MKYLLIAAALLVADISQANDIGVGRYLNKSDTIPQSQTNPLSAPATFTYPKSINTVGDAINHTLDLSGYTVANGNDSHYILFTHKLPAVHRTIGPNSIMQVLTALVGPAYDLKVNHLMREVEITAREDVSKEIIIKYQEQWLSQKLESPKSAQFSTTAISSSPKTGAKGILNGNRYHVVAGDSLSAIAERTGVTKPAVRVWMSQVLSANPHAFVNNDINILLEGSMLLLPERG